MKISVMEIVDLKTAPEHIPALARWHHQEWSELNPGFTLDDRINKMQAYLSDAVIPGTFIAKSDSIILGSSALLEYDMDTNRHLSPWLASVYVDEPYRNQGIGTKLVLHAMEVARNASIRNLYLFTPDQAPFYAKLGWTILSEENYRNQMVTVMQYAMDH